MRQRFFLFVSCIAAALVMAAPVAANSVPTTGTRISLFGAPPTFQAGAPFLADRGEGAGGATRAAISAASVRGVLTWI
jgi:hypothetical protein